MIHESNIKKLDSLYKSYVTGKCDSQSNLFYAFTIDKIAEIQEYLHSSGYKELLMNETGFYCKKSDIFRSVCIDKICTIINEEGNNFILIEQYIFLGKNNYHKPDITLFYGYNEDLYEDYIDNNLTNPTPDVIIEVVDVNDFEYLLNLIRVYKKSNIINESLVFFIDPIKKELYVVRNDVQGVVTDNDLMMCLARIDYYKDIQYKSMKLNFEKILSKQ